MFSGKAKPNSFWWPDQVDLGALRDHDPKSNPYGDDFDYAKAFNRVDLTALKAEKRIKRWPVDLTAVPPLLLPIFTHVEAVGALTHVIRRRSVPAKAAPAPQGSMSCAAHTRSNFASASCWTLRTLSASRASYSQTIR